MGFGLGSIGSIAGGLLGADAAGDGSKAMQEAAAQGISTIKGYDSRTRSDTAPYRNLGANSVNRLSYLLGLTPIAGGNDRYAGQSIVDTSSGVPTYNADLYNSDADYRKAWDQVASGHYAKYKSNYTNDSDTAWIDSQVRALLPQATDLDTSDGQYGSLMKGFTQDDLNKDVVYNTGLQFGLDQGNKSLNSRALAGGAYDSGATLKALTKWANDYGSTKAEGAYNRFNTDKNSKYSMLTGGTSIGQNAVNTSAGSGQAAGASIADLMGQGANAYAAGRMGEASGYGQAIGGLASLAGLFI